MDAKLFGALFGGLISILFTWVPYVNIWYAKLNKEQQQVTRLGLSVLLVLAILASAYFNLWVLVSFDKAGIMKLLEAWIFYLLANSSMDGGPAPRAVREIRQAKLIAG